MFNTDSGRCNGLLTTLLTVDFDRLSPHLERTWLSRDQTLHNPDVPSHHVYFPIDCIVSLQTMLINGASDEIAIVGNEGVVGVALIMGADRLSTRALVRQPGHAWRADVDFMVLEFRRSAPGQRALVRYSQSLLAQIAQTAVCNRHHTLDQQLCRWLLMTLDRLPSNQLSITQEQIANMLGVRREGVTESAGRLQRAGMIKYSRGNIEVLDRHKLEATACECYQALQRMQPSRFVECNAPSPCPGGNQTASPGWCNESSGRGISGSVGHRDGSRRRHTISGQA